MHEAFHRRMSREQIWKSQGKDEAAHLHFLLSDHTYLPVHPLTNNMAEFTLPKTRGECLSEEIHLFK